MCVHQKRGKDEPKGAKKTFLPRAGIVKGGGDIDATFAFAFDQRFLPGKKVAASPNTTYRKDKALLAHVKIEDAS